MRERPAIIEIETRDGGYRVELRDRDTGETIDRRLVDGPAGSKTPYKHVCKLRLPTDGTDVDIEVDDEGRIVLRGDGRTWYRHELPTQTLTAAN